MKGFLRLQKILMLEWVCAVKTNPLQRDGPDDMLFANPRRHKIVRESPAHVKIFAFTLFCVPDLMFEGISAPLDGLNVMGLVRP